MIGDPFIKNPYIETTTLEERKDYCIQEIKKLNEIIIKSSIQQERLEIIESILKELTIKIEKQNKYLKTLKK